MRNPLSLRKLVYLDGERAVIYRSRMNPSLGRNFEAMDSLEWLPASATTSRTRIEREALDEQEARRRTSRGGSVN